MAQYLSYEEYVVLGGKLGEAEYPSAELKARRRIDAMTHGRVARMARVPEEVKAAVAEIIDVEAVYGATAQAAAPVAESFSTDGYSESYGDARARGQEVRRQLAEGIAALLDGVTDDEGTPLLYAGVWS